MGRGIKKGRVGYVEIIIWDQYRFGAQKIYPKNPVTLDGIRDVQQREEHENKVVMAHRAAMSACSWSDWSLQNRKFI